MAGQLGPSSLTCTPTRRYHSRMFVSSFVRHGGLQLVSPALYFVFYVPPDPRGPTAACFFHPLRCSSLLGRRENGCYSYCEQGLPPNRCFAHDMSRNFDLSIFCSFENPLSSVCTIGRSYQGTLFFCLRVSAPLENLGPAHSYSWYPHGRYFN